MRMVRCVVNAAVAMTVKLIFIAAGIVVCMPVFLVITGYAIVLPRKPAPPAPIAAVTNAFSPSFSMSISKIPHIVAIIVTCSPINNGHLVVVVHGHGGGEFFPNLIAVEYFLEIVSGAESRIGSLGEEFLQHTVLRRHRVGHFKNTQTGRLFGLKFHRRLKNGAHNRFAGALAGFFIYVFTHNVKGILSHYRATCEYTKKPREKPNFPRNREQADNKKATRKWLEFLVGAEGFEPPTLCL